MMQIIQRRKIYYVISLLLIIPGLISLFMQGLNLGIDYEGGSILHVRISAETPVKEVREAISGLEYGSPEVQKSNDEFYIRTVELNQEQTKDLIQILTDKFGKVEFLSAESVGAVIGSELTRNALLSVFIAALLMLAYITVRFEWSFGVVAVLAIIHNVLIVLGAFSIFQWQINSAFIAAILTVVGYTINDTIVIFDRVRENMRFRRKEDYISLLNRSILQSFNRSINTVLTSAFALIALLLLGGETIKYFVAAMLIGFVVGAYSSIFIASPLWYELKTRA
jgi:preprotein translocase subunit SecF